MKTTDSRLDPALARQHFEKLLQDESRNLTSLEVLLNQEHELLGGSDLKALETAGNARQTCIAELLRIEDERRSLCRMLGFPADLPGLKRLLAWCDPANGLGARWMACMEQAARCRQLNDRNGALVTAKLKRVEGLLGVLTGRDNTAQTYGPQGSLARRTGGYALARA
jgi:flagella synthesis protein FlgN